MKSHLETCSKNATYISKTIQNEIIKCCGDIILDDIITDVKKAKYFTIIADEAHDTSNKELMSVVLRYVDPNLDVKEDFVGYVHLADGMTGANIADAILNFVSSLGLDIQNCRDQGCDGAGAMAGKLSGCSSRILKINNKAIYTHCFCHRLSLCVCSSLNITVMKDLFNYIKDISYFFNFCEKRQQMLVRNIEDYCPEAEKKKLKDICRTRWIERIEGIDTFFQLFVPLFYTLEAMSLNLNGDCNNKTRVNGGYFFGAIKSFRFIVSLVFAKNILDKCLPVTRSLQSSSIDILCALEEITSLKSLGQKLRNEVDSVHKEWYNMALDPAKAVDVEEWKPRSCAKQINRDNVPFSDISEYYKRTVTVPLLDNFVTDVNTRFNTEAVTAYQGLSVLPARVVRKEPIKSKSTWKEQFFNFAEFYQDDLPHFISLNGELDLWENDWLNSKIEIPNSISLTLKLVNYPGYSNIKESLKILATLSITSCERERSFSSLKLLKSFNRSTMLTERLNGMALLYIHQDREPDIGRILNKFTQMKDRRLELNV